MALPDKIKDFGWYGAGWAVFQSGTVDDDDFHPPLNDLEAQREWLAGFYAAWVEYPDAAAIDSILYGDGMGGVPTPSADSRTLAPSAYSLSRPAGHSAPPTAAP